MKSLPKVIFELYLATLHHPDYAVFQIMLPGLSLQIEIYHKKKT